MYFRIEEHSEYLLLHFHAAKSANALSLEVARELAQLSRRHRRWCQPVVVRSDHPRLFCSGGNLTDYKKLKGKIAGLRINREITRHLETFAQWPTVKIAWINGDVFGGGMEWLARFDVRWSAPHVLLSFWQRRIGLSPGWGGGSVWARKVGEENLRQMLLAATPLTAAEALEHRLIHRILPSWRIEAELKLFTRDKGRPSSLAANSWTSAKETKIFNELWLGEEHSQVLKSWRN